MTAGEEMDNVDVLGNNFKKNAEFKLQRIISAPFTKEQVNKVIGIEKEFNLLTPDQKVQLFRKLKPINLTKILTELQRIESGESDDLKNS